jgi:diamine N-acetyltransferase
MNIVKTTNYNMIQLKQEQLTQISSEAKIQAALKQDNCLGFYAYEEQSKVGFALLRKFAKKQFFLWNFIIDCRYQGCGKGKEFLKLLIDVLAKHYSAEVITTTYVYGNEIAKKLYESFGFIQTDVYCQDGVHEVNMKLSLCVK